MTTLTPATYSELKNDSRISAFVKKVAKCPSVNVPSPSRNAVTKTVPTGTSRNAARKASTAAATASAAGEAPRARRRRSPRGSAPAGSAAATLGRSDVHDQARAPDHLAMPAAWRASSAARS